LHGNSGYTNTPYCYVLRTPVLLYVVSAGKIIQNALKLSNNFNSFMLCYVMLYF